MAVLYGEPGHAEPGIGEGPHHAQVGGQIVGFVTLRLR